MVSRYKEMVLRKLWENKHPMTYNELSDDVERDTIYCLREIGEELQ